MKILKVLLLIILASLLLLLAGAVYAWQQRIELVTHQLNKATHELFEGTLRLKDISITKDWHIAVTGVTGTMKTETDHIPISIEKLETRNTVVQILRTGRSEIQIQNFQPTPSKSQPISGLIRLKVSPRYSSVRISLFLKQIFIEDYAWLNPPAFQGLSGLVTGDLQIRIDTRENAKFDILLESDEKGGEVPAQFLNFVLPYLPPSTQNSKELKKLIASKKTAHYSIGRIEAGVIEPGKIKAQIKMVFPEQNLNLNLNLTIIVDEKRAFFRAFKLLGLFKVKNS